VNNEIIDAGYKYLLSTSTVEIDSKYIRCSPLLFFESVRLHIVTHVNFIILGSIELYKKEKKNEISTLLTHFENYMHNLVCCKQEEYSLKIMLIFALRI